MLHVSDVFLHDDERGHYGLFSVSPAAINTQQGLVSRLVCVCWFEKQQHRVARTATCSFCGDQSTTAANVY